MRPLRISNIVRGRENRRGRVLYFIDAAGKDASKAIGEQVVLRRWRAREMAGHTFGGMRLSPTVWRAIDAAFKNPARICRTTDSDTLSLMLEKLRPSLRAEDLKLPSARSLAALLEYVGAERLDRLVQRHRSFLKSRQSGVPDLFLYARKLDSGKVAFARFVEVKRPGERLSTDQMEEQTFLESLGLIAGTLRLIERN